MGLVRSIRPLVDKILIIFIYNTDKESYVQGQHVKGIPPVLTEKTLQISEDHFPKSGTNLYLSCSALGQPEPVIYWLKNSLKIDHIEGELELSNLDAAKDNALYTCLAQNQLGIGELRLEGVRPSSHL